jgi:hypothetical protein
MDLVALTLMKMLIGGVAKLPAADSKTKVLGQLDIGHVLKVEASKLRNERKKESPGSFSMSCPRSF